MISIQGRLRTGSSMCRVAVLTLVLALAALMGGAGTARAAYPGANGAIAFQDFQAYFGSDGPNHDEIKAGYRTVTQCVAGFSTGLLPCDFGRPSYSPDGRTVVVSRQVPEDPSSDPTAPGFGFGNQGSLMLVGANGTGRRLLPRQTLDDEEPAFLPSATGIVFDGRMSPSAPVNLFTVNTDGTGLRQLTEGGGQQPAPCRSGAIAFVKHGDVYLLDRDRRSQRRLTFRGGDDPDCSPDGHAISFVRNGAVYAIGTNRRRLRRVASAQAIPNERNLRDVYFAVFSPDGREIAFLADYIDLGGGDDVELEVVDRKGRPVAPDRSVAGGGMAAGMTVYGLTAGISWQPVLPSECFVPHLVGKALAAARKTLKAAHCRLGKVTPPKERRRPLRAPGQKRIAVVRAQSPQAGSLEQGHAQVALVLVYKTVKPGRR